VPQTRSEGFDNPGEWGCSWNIIRALAVRGDAGREETSLVSSSYTHKNIATVKDAAPDFGLGENQEARFATGDLDAESTGFSHHRVKPGKRQGFGHRHDDAEEVYFVVSGSGRMKLDDDILDLKERDVVRVDAGLTRAFEAGDDGLEVLAFGARHAEDKGEIIQDWWQD